MHKIYSKDLIMCKQIASRVAKIQDYLNEHYLDALLIPHEDEYLSEYIAAHNERLAWTTGFTGSAGAAVILADSSIRKNAIFVDGRYTVQVQEQAPNDIFDYQHLISEPPLEWLQQLPQGSRIGFDPKLHSLNWYKKAQKILGDNHNLVALDTNPIDTLWYDRPQEDLSPIQIKPIQYSGQESAEKRQTIATKMENENVDALIITALDSICWLLNIRANDIPCLPVALSQAIVHKNGDVAFFIDEQRCSDQVIAHLGSHITLTAPSNLKDALHALKGKKVSLDPATTNTWIANTLQEVNAQILEQADPCALPKACKNKIEVAGIIAAHKRDAIAMVNFLTWLDNAVQNKEALDEAIISDKAEAFRRQQPLFEDLSFSTISAAGANAAMCHYNHRNQNSPSSLDMDNVYLIDSGAQYQDGTTDITRTIAIGSPKQEIIHNNTLVLKGHIALAQARFPQGTSGHQLDALARQFLWQEGLDFDHGTGHGVGAHLSVHEGPQRISPKGSDIPLQVGMVTSNEPGFYKENGYGIRIENLVLCTEKEVNNERTMLGFDTITLVPFDRRLIDKSMLTKNEIAWVDSFHQNIWNTLKDEIPVTSKPWLKQATKAL